MNIFQVLGFSVNNHSIELEGTVSNIKKFALLGTAICTFFQTSNTGRKIKRSSVYIKGLIKSPICHLVYISVIHVHIEK